MSKHTRRVRLRRGRVTPLCCGTVLAFLSCAQPTPPVTSLASTTNGPTPSSTPTITTPTVPTCGDGIVQQGEECDDGNVVDGDGCRSDCTRPLQLELVDADAKFVGEGALDWAGANVAAAGDVDGDGFGDILVAAPNHEANGAVYLVYGPSSGTMDLADADAKLIGEEPGDLVWVSLSGAGDVNGDGHDDILVGSPHNGEGAGAAYVLYGPIDGTTSLADADAKLVGEQVGDSAGGIGLSRMGDVDGDGFDDVLVNAYLNDEGGADAGAVYLVLGPVAGSMSLADADTKMIGAAEERLNATGAGDLDGDGLDDLVVRVSTWPDDDDAFVVYSPIDSSFSPGTADARLVAEDDIGGPGIAVVRAGDISGDGYDDLLVGAPGYDPGLSSSPTPTEDAPEGATYLLNGPISDIVALASADAKFVGESNGDEVGSSVSGAGDVDNDGYADVLVGTATTETLLWYGPVTGLRSLPDADVRLMAEQSFYHWGMHPRGISGAGDIDGDGLDDILIGDHVHEGEAGAAYLILGEQL